METRRLLPSLAAGLAVMFFQAGCRPALAQNHSDAVLSGQVSSSEEGRMEGVAVSAKRTGSTVTVSVFSDREGRYSFPADRLEPGQYQLAIRAVGYDLDGLNTATVAAGATATADLKLKKTKKLYSQLTNAEWLASMRGTDDQKAPLLNCNGCHTYERIARSTHNADEWAQVVYRMNGYAPVSQPIKPQLVMDPERAGNPEQYRKFAEYLTTVNLSTAAQWDYPLKTFKRPSGRATHVVITEYELPRPTIMPHDVLVDEQGMVWYSDFGEMFVSKFDPKTLQLTEYPLKELKPGYPVGILDLEQDKNGTLWFDMMFQGGLGNLDPKTGDIKYYPLAAEYNDKGVQLNFLGLNHDVDNKVWTKNVGNQNVYRVDIATGKWEEFQPLKVLAAEGRHSIYQVVSDSHNNLWMAEFTDGHIGRLDAKTGEAKWWKVPTPNARARRLRMDDQDRLWFTEYRGNKLAMFDTRTEKFTEWPLPVKWYGPYREALDRNGDLWAGTENADRVIRIDTKTGQEIEYLMPKETNMRNVFVDNSTTAVTVWIGSNHDHALAKVEPLD